MEKDIKENYSIFNILIIGATILLAQTGLAMDKQIHQGGVGFKAGWLHSTTLKLNAPGFEVLNGRDFDTRNGLAAGVYFDLPLFGASKLVIAADFWDIQAFDDREWMIDMSLGFRPLIHKLGSDVALKPGIALGVGLLGEFGKGAAVLEQTEYITFKTSIELMYDVGRKYVYTLELTFLGTGGGGNRDVDVKTNPAMIVRLGVLY